MCQRVLPATGKESYTPLRGRLIVTNGYCAGGCAEVTEQTLTQQTLTQQTLTQQTMTQHTLADQAQTQQMTRPQPVVPSPAPMPVQNPAQVQPAARAGLRVVR
ncbi:unnamed protein product [[Actinomadura] parvosata subsp. kistnae]|uniref:hypothetical protein n=1 Tax=[Actinomadura] parvosata TaxID=1955412 RepID=UPI000D2B6413|nr:hypothetical protein [Nonomuraea sp. ATCC 55076]SPL89022.1 unnamed protein product [Actinomadura parvosata subsp. kistnae]